MTSAFKLRGVVCPSQETPTPLNPHFSGPRCGISKVRGRHWSGRSGSVSPFLATPSHNHGESFAEPLANPLLSKWLCVLKDAWFVTASHLPVPQCQGLRRADSHEKSCRFCRPVFTRAGSLKPSEATRDSTRPCCPTFASGFCPPGGFRWPRERFLKVVSYCPRRAIRDNVCAATRMAQSERSRPSRTDLTARASTCFQAFRSNRRFMVSTSSPMSCGLRRNAFAPALRATASESVPDIITIGIYCR